MSKYPGDICQGTDANRYFAKFEYKSWFIYSCTIE